MPFSVHQNVDHPLSLYARDQEGQRADGAYLRASLSAPGDRTALLHGLWPLGPTGHVAIHFHWQDHPGEPIDVFNEGRHARDFTYIDDIVEGVVRANDKVAVANPEWSGDLPDPATSLAPYRLYNIGNHAPVQLMDYIACIEKAVGRTAKVNMLPMQPGDVPATFADVEDLKAEVGFEPKTPIEEGVSGSWPGIASTIASNLKNRRAPGSSRSDAGATIRYRAAIRPPVSCRERAVAAPQPARRP